MFNPAISKNTLSSALGNWWSRDYHGRDQINAIAVGQHAELSQLLQDTQEVVNATSRLHMSPFRTVEWYRLVLLQSRKVTTFDSNYPFAYTCDDRLIRAAAAVDLLLSPDIYWTGPDFQIQDGVIAFAEDPFRSNFVQYSQLSVEETSQVCEIWLRHAEFDTDTVSRQFGYVIGLMRKSSESYKEFLNAVYDSMVEGPTETNIRKILASGLATPVADFENDIVTAVGDTQVGHSFIATAQKVYLFGEDQSAVFSVGQTPNKGDPLTDGLTFIDTRSPLSTYSEQWTNTTVTRGWLNTCEDEYLIFENKSVPLILTAVDGLIKLTWEMPGNQQYVTRFFDELHARGVTLSQRDPTCLPRSEKILDTRVASDPPAYYAKGTLAHWLRGQDEAAGEPIASDLPATINPMQLLFDNVFGNNMIVVRTQSALREDNQNSLSDLTWLKKVLPPWVAILFLLELNGPAEPSNGNDGSLSGAVAANPLAEVCVSVDTLVRIRYAS